MGDHSESRRPIRWRLAAVTLAGVALVAAVAALSSRSIDPPARPALAAATTAAPTTPPAPALVIGEPVVAGDGRLYWYRGLHQPATFGTSHPLVSDTRSGPPKIAPGLSVKAAGAG